MTRPRTRTLGAIVLGAIAIVAVAYIAWPDGRDGSREGATDGASAGSSRAGRATSIAAQPKGAIRGVVRASVIASSHGTVRAGATNSNPPSDPSFVEGTPIAGARVCAIDRDEVAVCATTDARGAYVLSPDAGAYAVTASAPRFRPSAKVNRVFLAAGEEATLDLALVAGAVGVQGVVSDISGGAIPHAIVQATLVDFAPNEPRDWLPAVEADENGAFTLWLAPGAARLRALADGYAEVEVDTEAPGRVSILMTPEASIEGIVVDERGAPVQGARVHATWIDVVQHARTDAQGRFLVTKLVPARYDIEAHTDDSYGRSAGSVRVGLGVRANAGTIRIRRAARVSGRVAVDGKACPNAKVVLRDPVNDREVVLVAGLDGIVRGDGVRAGVYSVYPTCAGAYASEKVPRLVVGSKDLDLVWTLRAGGSVHGVVRTKEGAPVDRANLEMRWEKGYASSWSGPDGRYEIVGIAPGERELIATTESEATASAKVTIVAGRPTEQDLVLDVAAEIRGIVVDAEGRPVRGIAVRSVGTPNKRGENDPGDIDTTTADGRFTLFVRAGSFDVSADRGMFEHISKVERVIVELGDVVDVRLVVPAQTGVIRGRVVDAANAPVPDAYVTAYISDGITAGWRWSFEDHPVLTAADGRFVIDQLGAGTYAVEATRRGGGETKVHGVELGATLTLVLATTGSIRGTVAYAGGSHPTEMQITVRDEDSFFRAERFHLTAGAFTLDDLVPGPLTLAVVTDEGLGIATVTLAAGEQRTGVAITLERSHALRGRIVDARTKSPLAGFAVLAGTQRALLGSVIDHDDPARWSGPDGRFAILAPPGAIELEVFKPFRDGTCRPPLPFDLRGPLDVGDVPVVTTLDGEPGDLGVTVDAPTITKVAANSPAARAGLRVGDTLRAIDGVPVDGDLRACVKQLLVVPAGREIELTTSRTTVRIVAD